MWILWDDYETEARMDTFAGSAIPIDDTNAVARLFQTNTITINSNAVLETGRDARFTRRNSDMLKSLLGESRELDLKPNPRSTVCWRRQFRRVV